MLWHHFISDVNAPTTYQHLKDVLYRRGACILYAGQPGADLLIPFWKQTQTEPLISYILIQIENRKDRVPGNEMRDKLDPKIVFAKNSDLREPLTDIIVIMMEVGLTNDAPPHSERFTQNDYDSLVAKQLKRKDAKAVKDATRKENAEAAENKAGKEQAEAAKGDEEQAMAARDAREQDEAVQDDEEQGNAAQGADEQDDAATDNNNQEDPQSVPITSDAWTKWVYSVRGIYGESYPFLNGQSELRNNLVGLTKGSLNLEEWMACDKEGNTPPTSPVANREEEIGLTTVYPTN